MSNHKPNRNPDGNFRKPYIYIAARLYDPGDRLRATQIERATIKGLKSQITVRSDFTFLPYRDTHEFLRPDFAMREIFDGDVHALRRATAVVALLKDPAKDDGVCWEVGFAYGLRLPVIAVVPDSLTLLDTERGCSFPLEPFLDLMTGLKCGLPQEYRARQSITKVPERYLEELREQNRAVLADVEAAAAQLALKPQQFVTEFPLQTKTRGKPLVHVDCGGGRFEWQRILANDLITDLKQFSMRVSSASRWRSSLRMRAKFPNRPLHDAAWSDIAKTVKCDVLITCTDYSETDSGTAASQGLASALGKKIVMLHTGALKYKMRGGEELFRNIMLEFSSTKIVQTKSQVIDAVRNIIR